MQDCAAIMSSFAEWFALGNGNGTDVVVLTWTEGVPASPRQASWNQMGAWLWTLRHSCAGLAAHSGRHSCRLRGEVDATDAAYPSHTCTWENPRSHWCVFSEKTSCGDVVPVHDCHLKWEEPGHRGMKSRRSSALCVSGSRVLWAWV